MNITQYILDYLDENRSITVPGLGTFSKVYTPARVDEIRNVVVPPGINYEFDANDAAINDDIINYIADKEGISFLLAQDALGDMVRRTKNQVLQQGQSVWNDFGTFISDTNRAIKFISEQGNDPLHLGEVSLPPIVETTVPAPPPKEIIVEKIVEKEEVPAPAVVEEQVVSVEKKKTVSSVLEMNAQKAKIEANVEANATAPQLESGLPTPKPPAFKIEKQRAGSSWFWILPMLAILLIGLLVSQFLFYDNPMSQSPILSKIFGTSNNNTEQINTEPVLEGQPEEDAYAFEEGNSTTETYEEAETEAETETPAVVEMPVEETTKSKNSAVAEEKTPEPAPTKSEPVAETPPASSKTTTTSLPEGGGSEMSGDAQKGYHLVAGAFGSVANANKRAAQLKKAGYTPVIFKDKKLYKVTIYTGTNFDDAQKQLASVREKFDKTMWLYNYK
ncbi:MAG: SPOR domain-containing protein [Chitinophagales bacterium]|nr:SPOR domain-containing protein [Bacteroidota bacterium]